MITQTRKAREKEDRKNRILDACLLLIQENGVDGFTMDDIASRAEYSKGALYLYFKSKTEILLGLHSRAQDRLVHSFANILTHHKTGFELLHAIGKEYVAFFKENPWFPELVVQAEMAFNHKHESQKEGEYLSCLKNAEKLFSYILRCIQIGMADGSIVYEKDAKSLAMQFWGASRGLMQLAVLQQKGLFKDIFNEHIVKYEDLIEHQMELMLHALSKKND